MECFQSNNYKNQKRINREINKQIRLDKENDKKNIKLLILGTGESGKSTFLKQLQIIHGSGYSDLERRQFIQAVYNNIITAMQSIIKAMDKLQVPYAESFFEYATLMRNIDVKNIATLDSFYVEVIKQFWKDKGVQICYQRRREYELTDSAEYFFMAVDRVADPDYLPTDQDILRVRVSTKSIVEYVFEVNKNLFTVIDVGGQRSERRKWIFYFDNIMSVIYLMSLSEYDQFSFETDNTNKLEESKALFHLIVGNSWFKHSSMILFLNKTDIFEEKIKSSNLADYFPSFSGPPKDSESARIFIRSLFLDYADKEKFVYTHFTCATNTEKIRIIFNAVENTILHTHLHNWNLL